MNHCLNNYMIYISEDQCFLTVRRKNKVLKINSTKLLIMRKLPRWKKGISVLFFTGSFHSQPSQGVKPPCNGSSGHAKNFSHDQSYASNLLCAHNGHFPIVKANLHITIVKAVTRYAKNNLHEKITLHTAYVHYAEFTDAIVF